MSLLFAKIREEISVPLWSGLGTVLHWLSVSIGLLVPVTGLVAFFLREKIKQRLARSVALELEKERAELARDQLKYSSELQREMEAYRVSLIAEGERIKAQQQIRTAVALRIAEKRYTALSDINKAMASLHYDVTVLLDSSQDMSEVGYKEKWRKQASAIIEARVLKDELASFLSPTMLERCSALTKSVATGMSSRMKVDDERIAADSQIRKDIDSAFKEWRGQVDVEFKNLEVA